MRRVLSVWTFALAVGLPAVAAAQPTTDSPEPEFWLFVLLGSLPLLVMAYRQHRAQNTPVPVALRGEDSKR